MGQRNFTVGSGVTRPAILAACMLLASATGPRGQAPGAPPPDWMTAMGLATRVPAAKDFVQGTRPPTEALEFRSPYAAHDPRPRPRSAPEVDALARDLETAAARNRARAAAGAPTQAAAPPRSTAPR